MKPIKVAIVDDSKAIRAIVARLLQVTGRFEIVAEGETAAQALALSQSHNPDCMILDVEMPGGRTGLDVLPLLNCPVVILSTPRKIGSTRPVVFLDKLNLAQLDLPKAVDTAIQQRRGARIGP